MASFSWLHVTDLHCGMTEQKRLWPNVENDFFEDLAWLHKRCGPWDVIFFTGDLTQRGDAQEFGKLDELLDRLYTRLVSLGSKPLLLTVPGNHDLVRPDAARTEVEVLADWIKKPKVRAQFWGNAASPYRLLIDASLQNYVQWSRNHKFPSPAGLNWGQLPGDFAATIEKEDGLRVGVVGLNSTFLQLTDGNFEGKLAVSSNQLVAACGDHYQDWFRSHDACFLLTHQPPNWLCKDARKELEAEITVPGRFAAHLYGHMHKHRAYTIAAGGAQPKREWQGCSLFGLEKYGKQMKEDRSHGYSAGRLEVTDSSAAIRLWPRERVPHQAGNFHIIRAPSVSLRDDEGTSPEAVELQRAPSGSSSARFKFRVLLLSTETDLGETRRVVASHLVTALGVEVAEEPKSEEAPFDAAILLQGWWWDEGRAAYAWRECEAGTKITFFVDESSEWPPRVYTERSAEELIKEFRSALPAPALAFRHPNELAEKVNKAVTDLIQKRVGEEAAGLKEAERAYLQFRLSAWSSGRTARSRAHLVDSEHLGELYEADLYVPLDATAHDWVRSEDGRPYPVSSSEDVAPNKETRARLGRWLSVPELSKIALVGAPGGGKTVALTRVAAGLANACLGRPVTLEPDLDIEALRVETGGLPIPIVMEATRLAASSTHDVKVLIDAVMDEIAAAGQQLDRGQIVNGLKSGRYILLVDALDEIPDKEGRTGALDLLKGAAALYPKTRMVLTSRRVSYTGGLGFEPTLKVVEIAPFSSDQAEQFCAKWTVHRKRDEDYRTSLMATMAGLAEQVGSASGDQALTENPLMLTAICMVFERHRRLPDDRGSLCDLLIDDLCRSRSSRDDAKGWKLDDGQKKDLLQRIALAMQEEGAQTWPVSRAIETAMALVPAGEQLQAKRYLDWAADHTGLLRFHQSKDGEEQVRFWHRLFREYLAARQLAQLDTTAGAKVDYLWEKKYLLNPFWEDVLRLLPRALGTVEKAQTLRDRLESLANENRQSRGRLRGLAMAAIIENRDLYPTVEARRMAEGMARLYESEGRDWPQPDRVLFLEGLGRLDMEGGDPRLREPRWVPLPFGDAAIGWAPVTVQEYRRFLESSDGPSMDAETKRLHPQFLHPNYAVRVSTERAETYCQWLTTQRSDGKTVVLATVEVVTKAFGQSLRIGTTADDERWSRWTKSRTGLSSDLLALGRTLRVRRVPVGSGDEPPGEPVDLDWTDNSDQIGLLRFWPKPFRCMLVAPGEGDPARQEPQSQARMPS